MTRFSKIIFLLAVVLASCSYKPYEVIDNRKFPTGDAPAIGKREKQYILLDATYFKNPVDLNRICSALNNNLFSTEVQKFFLLPDEKNFLTGIDLLLNQQYAAAIGYLQKLDDSQFDYQVLILKTDCMRKLNYPVNTLANYQRSFDSSGKPAIKKISKSRYSFSLYDF